MKPDRKHESLKALYCELSREDERRAPSFAQVWQAAEARRTQAPRRGRWILVAAAAAVVLLAATGAILFGYRPWGQSAANHAPTVVQTHAPVPPQLTEPWIPAWESPTAFLLEPPAGSLTEAGSV